MPEMISPWVPMLVTLASRSLWQSIPRVADTVQDEGFPGNSAKRGALRLHDLHVSSERRDLAELVFGHGNAHLATRSDEDVHGVIHLR